MAFSVARWATTFAVYALLGVLVSGQSRAPKSSLSDLDLEDAEARLAAERALRENLTLRDEIERLKEKLVVAETSAARLTEANAMVRQEVELFRRQSGELKLRLEALGLTGGTNLSKLEQRLLAAVNDLRHSEEERTKLHEALAGLSEAVMNFARSATAVSAETRLALEQQLRRSGDALGNVPATAVNATAIPASLTDGEIISVKEELALVVGNIGSRQGVAVGMPFQVLRDDRQIAVVRVIDVRDRIAGLLIQDVSSVREKVKVGDRLKVAARQ